jgi:hypothetical protein
MNNYAVFIEGNDFVLTQGDTKEALGFFITVRVDANSEDEAVSKAMEVVKSNPKLAEAYTTNLSKKPSLKANVVHELLPENNMNNTGFTFYPMEEE